MRWTCPHCSADLTIAEGKLTKSWVFSQCHKCRGHVLLRAPEGNSKTASIHKVHAAQEETSEITKETQSTAALPPSASAPITGKPVIRPAQPRRQNAVSATPELDAGGKSAPSVPSAIAALGPPLDAAAETISTKTSQSSVLDRFKPLAGPNAPAGAVSDPSEQATMAFSAPQVDPEELPPPFPAELLEESLKPELEPAPIDAPRIGLLPMTLGVLCAVGTAAILFLSIEDQSPEPYPLVKPIAATTDITPENDPRIAERKGVTPPTQTSQRQMNFVKTAVENSATPVQVVQKETPRDKAQPIEQSKIELKKIESSIASTELVQYGPPEVPVEPAKKTTAELVAEVDSKKTTQAALLANSLKITTLSDQLHSQAMAPERPPAESGAITLKSLREPTEQPPLIVKPRGKTLYLRSGPGPEYPVIGFVSEEKNYIVTDWNDRWYRVLPQVDEVPLAGSPRQELDGWIRTDSVKVVQAQSIIAY